MTVRNITTTGQDPVAISASALVTGLGHDLDTVWEALLAGRSAVGPITGFDAGGFVGGLGAEARGVDQDSLDLPRREARIMDRHSFMLMKCTAEALTAGAVSDIRNRPSSSPGHGAGEGAGEGSPEIAFFAAIGMVDYEVADLAPAVAASRDARGEIDYSHFYDHGYREIFPLWPLSMLNNIAACQVAVRERLRGENTVFSPHADSGVQALVEAVATVAEGGAEQALAVAVSEKLSAGSLARAHIHGLVNTRERDLACRPFAADRAGSVLGEGSAAVLVERLEGARARGLQPGINVAGYGMAFGRDAGRGPNAGAMTRAMSMALRRAELPPAAVDLIVIHGDGTRDGDRNEMAAIQALFSATGGPPPHLFGSKGALGNLLAGAPLVDLILVERMVATGVIPPTVATLRPAPEARSLLVSGEAVAANPRTVMINAFSYEGQASSLLITALGPPADEDPEGARR